MEITDVQNQKIEEAFQGLEAEIQTEDRFLPIALSDLMAREFTDTEWVVDRLIPSTGLVVISGEPAAHKTWIVLHLALCVSEGGILFDKFATHQTGVLIVDEENGERLLQTRFKKLASKYDAPLFLLTLKGFKLDKTQVERVLGIARERGVSLIIFDSLVRIHDQDENDASKMARVFGHLKEFSKAGITVVITHHNRKQGVFKSSPSQNMRGSSDILASVDCHIAVERKEDHLVLTQTKLRQGEEAKPFRVNIFKTENEIRYEYGGDIDEAQNKKADLKEAINEVLGGHDGPVSKTELFNLCKAAGAEGGRSTFKAALKEMLDNGEVFEKQGEKNTRLCSLMPFDETPTLEEWT